MSRNGTGSPIYSTGNDCAVTAATARFIPFLPFLLCTLGSHHDTAVSNRLIPCSSPPDCFLFLLVTAAVFSTFFTVEDSKEVSEAMHGRDPKQQ